MSIDSAYKTLADIRDAVITDSKAGATDNLTLQTQVTRFINQGYADLIVRRKREWLDEDYFFVTDAEQEGTCEVTNGSTTVTFDTSTTISNTAGYIYKFFAGATDEIYDVASISSNTITLASAYTASSDTAATGHLVQAGFTLADEVKDIYQLDSDEPNKLIDLRGRLEFNERAQRAVQLTGQPDMATVAGVSTSSAKQVLFYPYAEKEYTLKAHCSKYFTELTSDTDEPLIPTEYRVALYFYAISRVYMSISRNVDLFNEAQAQYQLWLGRLDTEVKPTQDEPKLVYDKTNYFINPFRRFRNSNRYEPED